MSNIQAFSTITAQIQRELAEDLLKTLKEALNQPQERYTYGTPLMDAMVGCPPCNNHCNQGRNCPSRETRKTTREEKISKPAVYEIFDQLYAEHKTNQQIRNETLEEVAKRFDVMPFGDTAASFAKYVRDMKT